LSKPAKSAPSTADREPASVERLLAQATARLSAAGAGRADAEVLLSHILGLNRAQLFVRAGERPTAGECALFEAALQRRLRGEPAAYITGEQGFWTLRLAVTPAVLVPRPDTELLVEWALQCLQAVARPRLADLGTGSGCIALALASERPDADVLATDLSEAALAVARGNAVQLGLRGLHFVCADFAETLATAADSFDLIVSNPPYVAVGDPHLQDLRHEPLTALTDGADGLNALRTITGGARRCLRPRGWLLVEHGYDQGAAVRALFAAAGFAGIETRRDLAGHERATGGRAP
jgi:release factor glutamine methyltransferase